LRAFSNAQNDGLSSHRGSKDAAADQSLQMPSLIIGGSNYTLNNYTNSSHLSNLKFGTSNNSLATANSQQPQQQHQSQLNPNPTGLYLGGHSSVAASSHVINGTESQRPSMHVSASAADMHLKHNFHTLNATVQSGFHFHLAGFIDPEAGIPFHLPNVKNSRDATFIVHWCNNKDFYFTFLAEAFSKEIYAKLHQFHMEKLRQQKSKQSSMDNLDTTSNNEDTATLDGANKTHSSNHMDTSRKNSELNYLDFLLSLNLDDEAKNLLFGNSIDQKLDAMVKDWYSSHDILFSIHPFDGSVLIWLVDWLDEYMPGNYRQAQVSFHAKLPNSVPVGDAVSLTNQVFLYIEPSKVSVPGQMKNASKDPNDDFNDSKSSNGENASLNSPLNQVDVYLPGTVHLVSRHNNGTLNLWKLQFQESSKYQSLVYVSHLSRACGHRFRVNFITSHPILPFLLTNSINDLSTTKEEQQPMVSDGGLLETFQKGMIIWGVEPVGPLCKTGGIYELARIDSSKPNAFENIAWFPCFLPSSTLGNASSSPSTLFASTDADKITVYQAVFDARTLLHDIQRQNSQDSSVRNFYIKFS
jgi:hypothetical protein